MIIPLLCPISHDNDPSGEYLEGDPGEHVEEGTCGYGEDGKIGRKPAGPHLNKEAVDIHNVNFIC